MNDNKHQQIQCTGNGYDNRGAYYPSQSEAMSQPYLVAHNYPNIRPPSAVRLFMTSLSRPLTRLQAASPSHYPGCVPPWPAPGLYTSTRERFHAAPYANQTSSASGYDEWHNTQHDGPFTPAVESLRSFPESSQGQLNLAL